MTRFERVFKTKIQAMLAWEILRGKEEPGAAEEILSFWANELGITEARIHSVLIDPWPADDPPVDFRLIACGLAGIMEIPWLCLTELEEPLSLKRSLNYVRPWKGGQN